MLRPTPAAASRGLQATTEVGCGIAMCRQGTVGPEYLLTCRYTPAGNKGGAAEFTKNLPV